MSTEFKRLSTERKQTIIDLHSKRVNKCQLVDMFCISRQTVYRIIHRFQGTGSLENLPASGWPQLMSARDKRLLIRSVKNNRSTPLKEITAKFNENGNRAVSKRTVQWVLFKAGYHRRVVRKVIRIRKVNKRNRVAWCRGKRYLPVDGYWNRVIFSDESKVEIGLDNRVYIWRRAGEEWLPASTSPPPRKRLGVMIWGCITFNRVGTLDFLEGSINALKYTDILEDNLWPVVARHFPQNNNIIQDNNAAIHRAQKVMEYRVKNKIKTLLWPAQSPDLNII